MLDQDVSVGLETPSLLQKAAVAREDGAERQERACGLRTKQRAVREQETQNPRGRSSHTDEQHAPANERLENDAHRGAKGHAASDGAEQPAERAAALLIRKQRAHQGQRERHDTAGAEPGQEAPRDHLRGGLRCRRQDREDDEGRERSDHDAPTSDVVREQVVEERRDAVRDHVRGDEQPRCLVRNAEANRQARDERRDHVRLEEDEERGGC